MKISKSINNNSISFNNCNCGSSYVNVNHIHIYVDIDNNIDINIHIYVYIEIDKLIIISTVKMLKITIINIPINFRESYREDHNQLILIIS